MNIGDSDILYSFDRARLIDRARNGFMRIDGLTFKRARDYMDKYSARDYLMQCPLDLSTKELVSGMKDYCLQRRAEMLEPYRKKDIQFMVIPYIIFILQVMDLTDIMVLILHIWIFAAIY